MTWRAICALPYRRRQGCRHPTTTHCAPPPRPTSRRRRPRHRFRQRRLRRRRLGAHRSRRSPASRGLHSSTFQLKLSRFCHKIHPAHPLNLPKQLRKAPPMPWKPLAYMWKSVSPCQPAVHDTRGYIRQQRRAGEPRADFCAVRPLRHSGGGGEHLRYLTPGPLTRTRLSLISVSG